MLDLLLKIKPKMKLFVIFLFIILVLDLMVEAKKLRKSPKKHGKKVNLKMKKGKGKGKVGKVKVANIKGGKGHKHVHHKGIQHKKPETIKPMPRPLIHSTTPAALYSPPFVGIDNGQIPHDNQVDLILDYLSKIESTIDVFLRLQGTYPDGSDEQRLVVKNIYPPLRVLLEAKNIYDNSMGKS
jgi:hypothetical protein